mgnify:CR=1 FL=1
MKVRTKATLDGLALELTSRIYDLTTARALTPTEHLKRLDTLEHVLNLTLEVLGEARLEVMAFTEDTHVQSVQH